MNNSFKRLRSHWFRNTIGITLLIAAVLGFLYISIWWGLVQPIIGICALLQAKGAFDFVALGWLIVHIVLRDIAAVTWAAVCGGLGFAILK